MTATAPPPLPPTASSSGSTHPYATSSSGSGSGSLPKRPITNQPSSRSTNLPSISTPYRPFPHSTTSPPSRSTPPPLPPPTAELPPLPSSVTGHSRNTSVSSRSSIASKRRSTSPPRVSPRTSSLISPAQGMTAVTAAQGSSMASPGAGPSQAIYQSPQATTSSSPSTRPKPPRTPSRHLLQTALDLAQRAVEMDKNNDVLGALAAYREAVTRLKSVMERVGIEPVGDGKKRRSTGRIEEEGRTLRGIVSDTVTFWLTIARRICCANRTLVYL